MKKILFIVILPVFTNAQIIKVVDSITNNAIENVVFYCNDENSISDKNGFLNINMFDSQDVINITHVGYNDKKIIKKNITKLIKISPKTNFLQEINFNEKNNIYASFKGSEVIIPIDYIKSTSPSISEILKEQSSVSVQESQPGGGSPNFRGMEANRLLITIDGISLNNTIYRSGHTQSSSSINPFFLKTINLVTGPSSVVYGDGAMGNALIFNTSNPVKENISRHHFNQNYESSSNTNMLNYKANYYIKNLYFFTGFSFKKADNLFMGNNRLHEYDEWGKETNITKKNEQLKTNYWRADFIHKTMVPLENNKSLLFNTQFSTSSVINRFDKLNDINENGSKYSRWYYGPQKRFLQSASFVNESTNIFHDKLTVMLAFQKLTESRHVQKSSSNTITNRIEDLMIFDANLNLTKQFKLLELNYGFGGKKQLVESSAYNQSNTNNYYYASTRYPNNGSLVKDVFLYYQLSFIINKKTKAYLGSRYNYNVLEANFKPNESFSFPFEKILNKNNSLVNSMLINYTFSKNLSFNSCFYTGFRNPNIDDVGKIFSKGNGYVVIPNINLSPERSKNIEFGLNAKIAKFIKLNIQLFATNISDAISRDKASLNNDTLFFYDGDSLRIQMNKNIESANINGFNINIITTFSKKLILNSSVNYLIGYEKDDNPLAHIPPLNTNFNLKYLAKKNIYDFYILYNADKKTKNYDNAGVDNIEEATNEGNPSWFTLNTTYTRKIDDSLSLSFGVKNILDAHYKLFGSGLSSSGRNFTVSLHTYF